MSAEITRVIVDTTQGFKHFSLYLRGREELLVTVFHGNDVDVGGGGSGRRGSEAMDTICESSPSDIHSRPRCVTLRRVPVAWPSILATARGMISASQ